eukprot:2182513-Alexandrium_andersonii.AAC.1
MAPTSAPPARRRARCGLAAALPLRARAHCAPPSKRHGPPDCEGQRRAPPRLRRRTGTYWGVLGRTRTYWNRE